MMGDKVLTFIKKNKDELASGVGIDEMASLIQEIFQESVPSGATYREKVTIIYDSLNGDGQVIEGDLRKFVERLIKFVDGGDDPLEKNNLKARSSSGSSEEDDHRDNRRKRDRSRDKDKHKKSSKKSKLSVQSVAQMTLQDLIKGSKNNQNIGELLKQLVGGNNQQRQPYQNRKNGVFVHNLPKELKRCGEIEQLFANRGEIEKIQLGRIPCVFFKNPQDAQSIIEQQKFVVHKGVKIEFSATPQNQRRHEDGERKMIILDGKSVKQITTVADNNQKIIQEQQQQQKIIDIQRQEAEQKKQQSKEEHELQSQIESLKTQAKSLIAERIRLVLHLSRRSQNYSAAINSEIAELKNILKNKKDEIAKMATLDQIKSEIQWLNDNYDYTLQVSDVPELYFKDRTVTKVLNEYFSKYGEIDTLQLKLKDHGALIKYLSFEAAEKAYLSQSQEFKLDFVNKGIKKILIAQ